MGAGSSPVAATNLNNCTMTKHQQKELAKAIEKRVAEYQHNLNTELNAPSATRLYWLNRIEELKRKGATV